MTHVVSSMREPVTFAMASKRTGVPVKVIRRLHDDGKIKPKACLVTDARHPLLFELWEIEAALAKRDPRRVVHTMKGSGG